MFAARHCTFSSNVHKRKMIPPPEVFHNNLFQDVKYVPEFLVLMSMNDAV